MGGRLRLLLWTPQGGVCENGHDDLNVPLVDRYTSPIPVRVPVWGGDLEVASGVR